MSSRFLEMLSGGYRATGVTDEIVVLAVSGGADSVALLRGSVMIAESSGLQVAVAHFDHGLRGEASTADSAWVTALAAELDVPIHLGNAGTDHGTSDATGTYSEESLRKSRYAFLMDVARNTGSRVIVTAHTRNDQAETVLHHVLRGSGLRGLAGIPQRREHASGIAVVRPLLAVSRTEVEQFLEELGQNFRTDASNADPTWTRNHIRHELLPNLEERFPPGIDARLCSLADQAREAADLISGTAELALDDVLTECSPDRCQLNAAGMCELPDVVLRELFVRLWSRQQWPRREMTYAHWSRISELVRHGGQADFPGRVRVRCRDGLLDIVRSA